ncbi:LLM class F420-dependent oxidoreductase [Streptomyces decoyicus]|uniref:LLM class F420-dependent oxidoreductase n=1 Tax=Streptomyces decoyicus TaxID=249567 RepID=UPI00069D2604|nr:LLM class F420-dependent oxidoreductase [Streptomyces decoyicus]KOG40485.1 F420-dependent oxidoreductase [Streptomyces decoyicus]QZY18276.1 LLM class F420-dependent oxidoreductase [Streptomyces decoyicus]
MQDTLAARIGRVGVWHGGLGSVPAAIERRAAAEIERLGYGALWLGEGPAAKEAFSHAGLLLAATERITLATGIANIWARDAAAANGAAHTLAEAYDGRFLLGLGASHAPIVNLRGHAYAKPFAAMREYLDAMDAAPYEGPVADPAPARVLAALGPKMLELARDRTAGAHPYFVTPEHTARAREILGTGPLLAPEQAVLLESDPATARSLAREHHTRFYLELPNYTGNLRRLGFGDEDFAGGGSDRLVDAIVAWGDVDAVRRRVQEHHDAGADHVAIQPLATDRGLGIDQLRELAPVLINA